MCAVTTNEEHFYSARQQEAISISLSCIGEIKGFCEFMSRASFLYLFHFAMACLLPFTISIPARMLKIGL